MAMDENTKILVIEDNLAAIKGIQGILGTTSHLCAITLKGSLQALKEITDGTVQKMALIVDGSFFNFRNSSEKEEFFREPMDYLDLREWRDGLRDDSHDSLSEANTYMDSLFSTKEFTLRDVDNRDGFARHMLKNGDIVSPGSYLIEFILRIMKKYGLENIPLCFLLNSGETSNNDGMLHVIGTEPSFPNVHTITVPEGESGLSKKNDHDSIHQLLNWARQNG